MLELALIGITIAAATASYLYGQLTLTRRMLVEGKRREGHQSRELRLLHSKFTERAGFGSLLNTPTPNRDQPAPKRRVVPPSQTITELKQSDSGAPQTNSTSVPAGIGKKFLDINGNGSHTGEQTNG